MVTQENKPTDGEVAWAALRLFLGIAQMGGVVASLVLLIRTGLNGFSVGAVVLTTAVTLTGK
jgi:hypothetical protein